MMIAWSLGDGSRFSHLAQYALDDILKFIVISEVILSALSEYVLCEVSLISIAHAPKRFLQLDLLSQ